jgi:oligoendopeptidase F
LLVAISLYNIILVAVFMSARPGDAHHTKALSAQHKDDFLKALGSGMTVADACKVAGVKADTVKYWTKTDKKISRTFG